MFMGPVKRWLVSGAGNLVELTTLRIVGVVVFVRYRQDLAGLSYQELCRGVQGLVLYINPQRFDRLVVMIQKWLH